MKMSNAFPSKYLRASDFENGPQKLTIVKTTWEQLGDDNRPVVYFQETDKPVVLNKTNANTIVDAYGDESDGWKGKEIVLFASTTDLQGRQVDCIRMRKPKPAPKKPEAVDIEDTF